MNNITNVKQKLLRSKNSKLRQSQSQYQIDQSVIDKCNELYQNLPKTLQIPALYNGYDTFKKCLDICNSYDMTEKTLLEDKIQLQKMINTDTQPYEQKQFIEQEEQKLNTVDTTNQMFQQIQEQIKLTQYKISDTISLQRESQQKMDQILLQSTKRGSFAEKQIELLLQEHLPNFVIDKTAKISNSGDFQIYKDDNKRILLEIKNYTQIVPYCEVDKFIRDINADTKIKYGCFVSIGQKIAKTPNIHVMKLQNNKIVCFLGNFGLDNFQILIHILLFLEQTQVFDSEQIDIEHQIKLLCSKTSEYLLILQKNKKDLTKQLEIINNQINLIETLQESIIREKRTGFAN